jgi:hypothetical protein
MIEFQVEMEKLFNKNQLIPRIKKVFKDEPQFEAHMKAKKIPVDFGYDLLTQLVLHKRASISTMVGILRRHFDGPKASQQTADAILAACHADLCDWCPITSTVVIRFEIGADVQAELDRYQFPLPMVVPPLQVKGNEDTGYYTSKGSIILKDNHHDGDVCLDHINRVNRTRLRINPVVAAKVQNSWKNLDKPKVDEEYSDYEKRVKQFKKYDSTSRDVMLHLGISNGSEFYLTHKVDKRGRTYCQGYHVNYQGTPWNKAVIEFATQELPTG